MLHKTTPSTDETGAVAHVLDRIKAHWQRSPGGPTLSITMATKTEWKQGFFFPATRQLLFLKGYARFDSYLDVCVRDGGSEVKWWGGSYLGGVRDLPEPEGRALPTPRHAITIITCERRQRPSLHPWQLINRLDRHPQRSPTSTFKLRIWIRTCRSLRVVQLAILMALLHLTRQCKCLRVQIFCCRGFTFQLSMTLLTVQKSNLNMRVSNVRPAFCFFHCLDAYSNDKIKHSRRLERKRVCACLLATVEVCLKGTVLVPCTFLYH